MNTFLLFLAILQSSTPHSSDISVSSGLHPNTSSIEFNSKFQQVKCYGCSKLVNADWNFCKHCGTNLQAKKDEPNKQPTFIPLEAINVNLNQGHEWTKWNGITSVAEKLQVGAVWYCVKDDEHSIGSRVYQLNGRFTALQGQFGVSDSTLTIHNVGYLPLTYRPSAGRFYAEVDGKKLIELGAEANTAPKDFNIELPTSGTLRLTVEGGCLFNPMLLLSSGYKPTETESKLSIENLVKINRLENEMPIDKLFTIWRYENAGIPNPGHIQQTMTVAGRLFNGLVLQSTTIGGNLGKRMYLLDEKPRNLKMKIGINDESNLNQGSITVKVDGEVLLQERVSKGEPLREISQYLGSASSMVLVIEGGIVCCNPRVEVVDVSRTLAWLTESQSSSPKLIMEGLESIHSPGSPGTLNFLDSGGKSISTVSSWEPFVVDEATKPEAFAAGRLFGKGRIIALAHEQVLLQPNLGSNLKFRRRCLEWLSKKFNPRVMYTRGHDEKSSFNSFSTPIDTLSLGSLEKVDTVLVGNAWAPFSSSEIDTLEKFVVNGGSIMFVGLGWSFPQFNPNQTIESYPMNVLGARFGISWNLKVASLKSGDKAIFFRKG